MSSAVRDDPDAIATDTSVGKALSLLDCFGDHDHAVGVTEMARRVGLPKSTVHRLVALLVSGGYLERLDSGRYRLGIRVFELGSRAAHPGEIRRKASPVLHDLSRITGEVSHLAVLEGDDVIYVEKVESSDSVSVPSMVGRRNPAVATAVGKAMLAWKSRHDLLALAGRGLPLYTPRSLNSADALLREVDEIRRTNLALDDEERAKGLVCVAAPVRDRSHRVVAAVSLAGSRERMSDARRVELSARLQGAAAEISRRLGFTPRS